MWFVFHTVFGLTEALTLPEYVIPVSHCIWFDWSDQFAWVCDLCFTLYLIWLKRSICLSIWFVFYAVFEIVFLGKSPQACVANFIHIRSCWLKGRGVRFEEKKYHPIVWKWQYLPWVLLVLSVQKQNVPIPCTATFLSDASTGKSPFVKTSNTFSISDILQWSVSLRYSLSTTHSMLFLFTHFFATQVFVKNLWWWHLLAASIPRTKHSQC